MSETIQIRDLNFRPLYSAEIIADRVRELAVQIAADYRDREPVFIVVLNGAFLFAADLARYYPGACEFSFIKLRSYQGVSSTGEVSTLIGLSNDLQGRDLLIVEDIVDSGLTMQNLLKEISELEPASVRLVSLLVKPEELVVPLEIHYTGFEIEPQFVVGYGMDYDELGRNLPAIYQRIPDSKNNNHE